MDTASIDFKKPCHIYFMGIGGVSMGGPAEILQKEGFSVNGSDAKESELTKHLKTQGIRIYIGQRAENLNSLVDYVIYTAAIHPDDPEFRGVRRQDIPVLSRMELLGQLMHCYGESIAISGAHGKITIASILPLILLAVKKDPIISFGGNLDAIGGNTRVGGGDISLPEACGHTNSFLSFFPALEVILSIEADHFDFFRDIGDIRHSFRRFVRRMPESGNLVTDNRIRDYQGAVGDFKGKAVVIGTEAADYYPTDTRFDGRGNTAFTPTEHGKVLLRIQLCVPGEHNVCNVFAALAICRLFGVLAETVCEGLEAYYGTEQHLEKKGEYRGAVIAGDYVHHPQEITAALKTARGYPHEALWCVFQSYTYARTEAPLPDFDKAFGGADHVLLADIYAAWETDTLGISSRDIAGVINADQPGKVRYFGNFGEVEDYFDKATEPGDFVLTMGAGDIFRIGEEFPERAKVADVEK